jgi:thiamine-phosphate pyrophosphorylase
MPADRAIRGLYIITDNGHATTAQLVERVTQAIIGGGALVQYRGKSAPPKRRLQEAAALQELCQRQGVPLIINDDIELARSVTADGVHLGRNDAAPAVARRRLGEQALIGVSCYNRLDNAIRAEQAGADYVAFGSFFPSATKPDAVTAPVSLLRQARQRLSIPIVAIGGITAANGATLIGAGAAALAVISGVFAAADIRSAAGHYAQLFTQTN